MDTHMYTCIHADTHVSFVIKLIEINDDVHITRESARVRNTPHAQIELIENSHNSVDWANAKVIDRQSDKAGILIREAIWIRKTDNMNRDEGSY